MIYQSTKKVKIIPMLLGDYNALRGWEIPADEDLSTEGYLVEYTDGGKANHPDFENYISWSPKDVFDRNYIPYTPSVNKTVSNTDQNDCKDNVPDVEIFGEDLFKLLSKASSKKEGWMKSTKAMETPNGCIVQVTTQQGDNIAEALTFVPGVFIRERKNSDGEVIGRILYANFN